MAQHTEGSKDQAQRHLGGYSILNASGRQPRTVSFTLPSLPNAPRLDSSGRRRLQGVVALLVIIIIAATSGAGGAWLERHGANGNSLVSSQQGVDPHGQLVSQIAGHLGPSVVSINVSVPTSASIGQDSFGLFDFSGPQTLEGAGTGIIIANSGVILTNRHVVPIGTSSVSVTLSDGTELKNVSILGRTSENDSLDVAFLKINDTKGHKLKAATLGNSAAVEVGDNVVAIGNALGQFQNTVTSGIISGYGRSVLAGDPSGNSGSAETLDNLFQTDAAINEGNSGGPLVNLKGEVIGINTAVAGDAQNIGFAIPINDVHGLVSQVLKNGKFARPYLGVRYVPLTPDAATDLKLKTSEGAYVPPTQDPASPSIVKDGPADKAGIHEQDIITTIDGTKVDHTHSLISLLTQHQPGDKIKLTVLRGDKTLQLSATLGELPAK